MSDFGKEISLSKLVIMLKSGENKRFYSLKDEDKKGQDIGINGMIRRLINRAYQGKYITAIIYDNKTDQQLHKWVNGIKAE